MGLILALILECQDTPNWHNGKGHTDCAGYSPLELELGLGLGLGLQGLRQTPNLALIPLLLAVIPLLL